MSKKTKELSVQEIQNSFEVKTLPEQLQLFKAMKIVLEDKKKEAAKALQDLEGAKINE